MIGALMILIYNFIWCKKLYKIVGKIEERQKKLCWPLCYVQKHNIAPSPRRSTERDPYGRERGNRIPLPACYDKVTALEGGIVFVSQKFDRKIKEKIQKTTSCTYSSHCHERYMQDVLCQVSLWSSSQAKGGSSDALKVVLMTS